MRMIRADQTVGSEQTHRQGSINLRRLFKGKANSPNNFEWSLVRMGTDYRTPRHRHNFSQIIMVLEGEHEWIPSAKRGAGTVTYTCEGTYYGPQQGAGALLLTLQFGEASGNGFLDYDELDIGRLELAKRGSFANGVYSYFDAAGQKHNQDSYEAIWENVNGRPISYSRPRYASPITIHPDGFEWVPISDEAGIQAKRIGTFSERGTTVEFVKYEANAKHRVRPTAAPELHFVLEGSLQCSQGRCETNTAMMFEPNDDEVLEADERSRAYVIKLPDLRPFEQA